MGNCSAPETQSLGSSNVMSARSAPTSSRLLRDRASSDHGVQRNVVRGAQPKHARTNSGSALETNSISQGKDSSGSLRRLGHLMAYLRSQDTVSAYPGDDPQAQVRSALERTSGVQPLLVVGGAITVCAHRAIVNALFRARYRLRSM